MPLVRVLIVFFLPPDFLRVCVPALGFLSLPFRFFIVFWVVAKIFPRYESQGVWGGVCVTCEAGKGFFSPDLDRRVLDEDKDETAGAASH